jgi:hypothetical protein
MIAALTLSDVAGLAAVIGVLAVPLATYLRILHQRTITPSKELASAREREEALAGAVARGFSSAANVDGFAMGLIERGLTDRFDEVDPRELLEAHRDLLDGIRRAWAEASVLSDDDTARDSALRQLEARLGDERSARIVNLRTDDRHT